MEVRWGPLLAVAIVTHFVTLAGSPRLGDDPPTSASALTALRVNLRRYGAASVKHSWSYGSQETTPATRVMSSPMGELPSTLGIPCQTH